MLATLVERLRGAPHRMLPGAGAGDAAPARRAARPVGPAVHRAAERHRVTPFAVVTAALAAALRRHGAGDDVTMRIDLPGRDGPGQSALVGYFGNQLPLRVDLAGVSDLREALPHVRDRLFELVAAQDVGYDDLVQGLRRAGEPWSPASFDVKLAHQLLPGAAWDGFRAEVLDSGWASGADPFALWVWERDGTCVLEVHHRLAACSPAWADQVLDDVARSVDALAANEETGREAIMGPVPSEGELPGFEGVELRPLDVEGTPTDRVETAGDTRVLVLEVEASPHSGVGACRDRIRAGLREHGAVLLRGCGVETPGALGEAAAALFDAPYRTSEHPRQVLGETVVLPIDYPPELELYWHNEDAFNAVWPRLIAFACARPADEGGETTVVDGRAVAAGLRPESLRRFRDEGVRYVRRFLPGLGLHWSAVFGTDDRAEVTARCAADGTVAEWDGDLLTTSCVRPAVLTADDGTLAWFAQILHWHPHCLDPVVREQMTAGTDGALPREVAFGDGSPIPADVVDEVIALSRSSEYPVGWQRGDLLLVDNARTAHGRRTYHGERRIMVSMGEPTPSTGR